MSSSGVVTFVGGAFVALLIAGYYAQRSLPPPLPKLVGVDLGTTYSCIGAYQSVTGKIIIYEDEENHKCIPSVVAYSDGEILVGYDAVAQQEHNPFNTLYDAKRFIGKQFTRSQLEQEARRYSFKIELDDDGFAYFVVKHKGHFLRVTPEEVGGHIIKTLVNSMRRNFSDASLVPKMAVASVPAEFKEVQRNATIKAFNYAGLSVKRVINEPTAAALAYGLHKKAGVNNVLVVDLGGGTLDVSLLSIQGGMFLTMAMAGNNHLGGQDFNMQLQQYLLQDIEKQFNIRVSDPEDLQTVNAAVEAAKINLTYELSSSINIKLHSLPNSMYKKLITRTEFEEINQELFDKVLEPIEAVLESTELSKLDINEIVMVGGSTRIPKIRELVSTFFNHTLNTGVDADLAVVSGVAIQAGIIGGMWPLTVSAVEVQTSVQKIILS